MSEISLNSKLKQHEKQLFNKCLNFINLEQTNSSLKASTNSKNDKNWHYLENLMHLREYRNANLMKNTLVKENGIWKINKSKVRSQATKDINFLFSSDHFQYQNQINKNSFRFKNQSNAISRPKEFNDIYNTRKKLSLFYGYFTTRKLKELITKAQKYPGYFSKNFFSLLEQRIDVSLYRSGFAPSIMAARQLCLHGKVKLNSQICTKSNTALKPGDIVSLDPKYNILNKNTNITSHFNLNTIKFLNYQKNTNRTYYNRAIKNLIIGSTTVSIISKTRVEPSNKLRFDLILRLLTGSLRSRISKRLRNKLTLKSDYNFNLNQNIHEIFLKLKVIKKPKILYTLRNSQFRAFKNRKKLNKVNTTTQIKRFFTTTRKVTEEKTITLTKINTKNSHVQENLKNNIFFHFLAQISQSSLLRKKALLYSLHNNLKQINGNYSQINTNTQKRSEKPTNLEISKKTSTFVYLFAPQRIKLPFIIDIDTLKKLTRI